MNPKYCVVPAQPGFSVVGLISSAPQELYYEPIIAWIVDVSMGEESTWGENVVSGVTPVTVEGSNIGGENYYIKYPDGRIIDPQNRSYPAGDEAQVLKDMLADEERNRQMQEKLRRAKKT